MHSSRRILLTSVVFLVTLACRARQGRVTVRFVDQIEFTATVHARHFDSAWIMPGYHAVVWKGGRAAPAALFVADVSDRQVSKALADLGGKPGNNLPMESWEKRRDPSDSAPDLVIRGSPVDVFLRLPGRADLTPLASVLQDSGGRGLDMRFGGNEANIPRWKSGCIACLYSCPGSKVGNARYTERDYARKTTSFRVRPGVLPADGTPITVVLRLRPSKPG